VAYDYQAGRSIPVMDGWIKKILIYEGIEEKGNSFHAPDR
jgi:hypothetical protein